MSTTPDSFRTVALSALEGTSIDSAAEEYSSTGNAGGLGQRWKTFDLKPLRSRKGLDRGEGRGESSPISYSDQNVTDLLSTAPEPPKVMEERRPDLGDHHLSLGPADRDDAREDHRHRQGGPHPIHCLVSDRMNCRHRRSQASSRSTAADAKIPFSLIGYFILFFLLGYFLYASFYTAIGAPFNTNQEAQQLSMIPTLMIVSGMSVYPAVMNNPNGTVAVIASLFPFTAPLIMFLRTIAPSILSADMLCVASHRVQLGIAWRAGRIYRVGYSVRKKPGPRSCVGPQRTGRPSSPQIGRDSRR